MDEQAGMKFETEKDENGNDIPAALKVSFLRPAMNKKPCICLKTVQLQENIESNEYHFSVEQRKESYRALESDRNERNGKPLA